MNIFTKFTRKAKLVVAGAILAVGLATGAALTVTNQQTYADTCDKVNIIHCGLAGSTDSSYIKSLQKFYHNGSDNGHKDLKAVYNWAGWSTANIDAMNTKNTKVGTLYRNGNIKVDGKVVATDAWVSARFTSGKGFKQIAPGVWARKTTTSFANPSVPVLVHFKGDGTFDAAVMVNCGNSVKATNVVKPPKPVLTCSKLVFAKTSDTRTFTFTATAAAKNTKIVSYVFKFGDGATKTVSTSSTKASVSHKYSSYSKSYKTTVYVNGSDQKNVTSSNCDVTVKTPAAPAKPELACVDLKGAATSTAREYTFTAKASAKNTKIVSYVFNFGDGTSKTVTTSATTANVTHKYSDYSKSYTTSVSVNGTDQKNVTNSGCKVTVTTPKPPVKPELACVSLDGKLVKTETSDRTATFKATASAKNTKIVSYVFNFGDGTSKTVTTSASTASVSHTYSAYSKTYSASVAVNGTDQKNVTATACKTTVTTPKPPVKPVLACDELTFKSASTALAYTFTATATASNTKILSYNFKFSDGTSQTVTTSAETANVKHTFADYGKSYTATVYVNGTDQQNVTDTGCKVVVKTPEAPKKPALTCENLTFQAVADKDLTYTFTATANATNTTIVSYVFDFGDGATTTVPTSAETANTEHTYAQNQAYTATVTVNSKDITGVTSETCKVQIAPTTQPCVPKEGEDENCQPTCVPTATQDENCNELPPTLVNTGPGAIAGLFAGTSVLGAGVHQIVRRRSNRNKRD